MDKLNKQQLSGISKLVHHINDRNVIQCILETIGRENWTRGIFSNCADCLTLEQEEIYEEMGGGYDWEEIEEYLREGDINEEIAEKLKEQGVTHYLYENEDYLDEIREGTIVCEGINVEEIKNMLFS